MTGLILALLLQATAPAAAPPPTKAAPPSGHERLFLSPMGEPFRGAEPQLLWFDQADTNHDGVLTLVEFEADAARFFAKLDREHDGEIDPGDLDYYETTLVPEIRVAYSDIDGVVQSGGGSTSDAEDKTPHIDYPDRQGAARYSWFDYPEPIIICDTNFNRGVDAGEFRKCADDRFAMLDSNHDGVLRRDELPGLRSPGPGAAGGMNRRGRGDRHRQH